MLVRLIQLAREMGSRWWFRASKSSTRALQPAWRGAVASNDDSPQAGMPVHLIGLMRMMEI
jgi:hypothetical protein